MSTFTPAKYDNPSRITTLLWLGAALLLVGLVRLHGLSAAALPDYDSVRNWQIVQEVAAGDLRHVFHHRGPGFFLLFAPVAALRPDFHWFLYLNVGLSVVAVGWLTLFVATATPLRPSQTALLALLIGTSVFLTFSARDFTISSVSLVLYAGLLQTYYRRLHRPGRLSLLPPAIWLALGLTVNYKFLLALPIIGVLEWLRGDKLAWQPRSLLRVLFVLALPYVLLSFVAWLVGVPWWRWLATYYDIFVPTQANAAGRTGHLQLDLLYYPRFLADFESPFSWVGLLLFPIVFWADIRASWRQPPRLSLYLAVWAYSWVGGMSLLLKAPRGLLFAYGLCAALGFLALLRLSEGRVGRISMAVLTLAAIGYNLVRIQAEVYAYTPTQYPAVAAWLRNHHAAKVASTMSLGLAPFTAPDSVQVVRSERELPALRQRGYRYVLLDGYWRVTHVPHFDSLRQQWPVAAWREPLLTAPLLFLEHSEFTGLSYQQTLAQQQLASRDSVQLLLFELSNK